MAVVNKKSTPITNADAKPRLPNTAVTDGGIVLEKVGTLEAVNGDSINSTYRMLRISSSTRVTELLLYCDAITTCSADIGLYRTADDGGAVVDADFFAAEQLLDTASVVGLNVLYEAAAGPADVVNIEKRVWQMLGLTADPGVQYDVALTLTAAAGSAGTISLKCRYVD